MAWGDVGAAGCWATAEAIGSAVISNETPRSVAILFI
jgi:hypothetical protein